MRRAMHLEAGIVITVDDEKRCPPDTLCMISQAISLHRIADLLDANLGANARNEYGETPFEAIGAGIARALRANG